MKLTVIPLVGGAPGKETEFDIRGKIKNIQTTIFIRSARILRRIIENEKTCYHSDSM